MGFVLGESRGRKPCVFSGKVAPAGDERYLMSAAGAAAVDGGLCPCSCNVICKAVIADRDGNTGK